MSKNATTKNIFFIIKFFSAKFTRNCCCILLCRPSVFLKGEKDYEKNHFTHDRYCCDILYDMLRACRYFRRRNRSGGCYHRERRRGSCRSSVNKLHDVIQKNLVHKGPGPGRCPQVGFIIRHIRDISAEKEKRCLLICGQRQQDCTELTYQSHPHIHGTVHRHLQDQGRHKIQERR